MDNYLHYILPFMGSVVGVAVGAWLTNSFFPFQLKRREWRWEKELWAKELFFETLSRIHWITEHYLKEEYEDQFSMHGLGLHEANKEILKLVKHLHSIAHKLRLYLSKSDSKLFEEYLKHSQLEYDEAKLSWGMWDHDDRISPALHIEESIAAQGKIAARILVRFKPSY